MRRLHEIATLVGGSCSGGGDTEIRALAGVHDAREGELTFIRHEDQSDLLGSTRASAAIVPRGVDDAPLPVIQVADPAAAFESLVDQFRTEWYEAAGEVHPDAYVAKTARIGSGASVWPCASVLEGASVGARSEIRAGARIEPGARIGEDTVIHANVVIGAGCVVGDRVVIHAGTVVGADGFGYRTSKQGHEKVEHIGVVEIEDDVEIGASCCIDRARFGRTRVGRGTKIDNLVHIAHNVQIGEHCLIIAQTGISGSTVVEPFVAMGGQVGVVGHVRIGRGAKLAARSGISKDVPPGAVLYGFVAGEHRQKKREEAAIRRLPELLKRIRALEAQVRALGQDGSG